MPFRGSVVSTPSGTTAKQNGHRCGAQHPALGSTLPKAPKTNGDRRERPLIWAHPSADAIPPDAIQITCTRIGRLCHKLQRTMRRALYNICAIICHPSLTHVEETKQHVKTHHNNTPATTTTNVTSILTATYINNKCHNNKCHINNNKCHNNK